MSISIRVLQSPDAEACDRIMRSLPEWFGYEPGLQACAEAVRTQAGWVAVEDGEVIGFATWEKRTDATAEVTWMAVRGDKRNSGVGTAIIERLCEDLAGRGYQLALAMTSARHKEPATGPDVYEETRAFWARRGFMPLIELDIWDTDVALLMVRPLKAIAPV